MALRLSPETRARVPRLSFFGTPVHPPLTDRPVTLFTLAPALDWAAVASVARTQAAWARLRHWVAWQLRCQQH